MDTVEINENDFVLSKIQLRLHILDLVTNTYDLMSPAEHVAVASVFYDWLEPKMTDNQIDIDHPGIQIFSGIFEAYSDMEPEQILEICDTYFDWVVQTNVADSITQATQSVAHI